MNYLTDYEDYSERSNPKEKDELDQIIDTFQKANLPFSEFPKFYESMVNEGMVSRMLGGLTGLTFGKTIGRFLISAFSIPEGSMLFKLFSSKLFFTAVGAAMGKNTVKDKELKA